MPASLQKAPADMRARLEAITARSPTDWILVEATPERLVWIVPLTGVEGHTAAEIAPLDSPAIGPRQHD